MPKNTTAGTEPVPAKTNNFPTRPVVRGWDDQSRNSTTEKYISYMKHPNEEYGLANGEGLTSINPDPLSAPAVDGALSVVPTAIPMGLAKYYAAGTGIIGQNPPLPPAMPGGSGSALPPVRGLTLREVTEKYFVMHERIALMAPPNTKYKTLESISNERGHMIVWLELFGNTPVALMDERSKAQFVCYRQNMLSQRQYWHKDGTEGKVVERMVTGATIDLCNITVVVIFKWAFSMGLIHRIPFWYSPRMKQVGTGPKRRELLSVEHVNAVLVEAVAKVPPGSRTRSYCLRLILRQPCRVRRQSDPGIFRSVSSSCHVPMRSRIRPGGGATWHRR